MLAYGEVTTSEGNGFWEVSSQQHICDSVYVFTIIAYVCVCVGVNVFAFLLHNKCDDVVQTYIYAVHDLTSYISVGNIHVSGIFLRPRSHTHITEIYDVLMQWAESCLRRRAAITLHVKYGRRMLKRQRTRARDDNDAIF